MIFFPITNLKKYPFTLLLKPRTNKHVVAYTHKMLTYVLFFICILFDAVTLTLKKKRILPLLLIHFDCASYCRNPTFFDIRLLVQFYSMFCCTFLMMKCYYIYLLYIWVDIFQLFSIVCCFYCWKIELCYNIMYLLFPVHICLTRFPGFYFYVFFL